MDAPDIDWGKIDELITAPKTQIPPDGITRRDIEKRYNVGPRRAREILLDLCKTGAMKKHPAGHGTYYTLVGS